MNKPQRRYTKIKQAIRQTPLSRAKLCPLAVAIVTSIAGNVCAERVEWLYDSFDGSISDQWIITGVDSNSTATPNSVESPFGSGTGSLTIDDNSTAKEVKLQYTLPTGESIEAGESLTLEFDYFITDAKFPFLTIGDDSSTAAKLTLHNSFKHFENGTAVTLTSSSTGTWYRLSYTYHNNDTTDLIDISRTPHNGSPSVWNGHAANSNQSIVNTITFQFNVNDATAAKEWKIDNVRITETRPDANWFDTLQTTRIKSDPNLIWEQFGPGMSGNNYRIYWHPTDESTVFLGPNMGMSYRSTNKGFSYEGIFDEDGTGYSFRDRGPIEIGSPDFSRQNPDLGFCTGEDATFIYKTTDRGKEWERHTISDPVWEGQELNAIAVDPNDDQIWYVGSGNIKELNKWRFTQANPHGTGYEADHTAKIWKTIDQGDTWTEITPSGINSLAQIQRILVHPNDSQIIFAATNYGFFRSDDGGANWNLKHGTPQKGQLDRGIIRSLDMHYDNTSKLATLYVIDQVHWKSEEVSTDSYKAVNDGGGIFKSTDNGESWQSINGDLAVDISQLKSNYTFKLSYWNTINKWFDITDAKTTYNTIYPTELLQNVSVVRVDPNNSEKIFVLNDYKHYGGSATFRGGMLWRSDNGGDHWIATLRNGTAWEGDNKAYWESRGNPTVHNMELRGQHEWKQRDSYEQKAGGSLEISKDSSVIMFQWAKVLCRSLDGGDTWAEDDEIEATPGTHNYVSTGNSNLPGHGFNLDPRYPNTVFSMAGENDFWVSSDDGWNIRSSALASRRNSLGHGEFSCSDVEIHPKDKNIIYTLQFRQKNAGDLLKSTDGGKTFEEHGLALKWPVDVSENDQIHQLDLCIDPTTALDEPEKMYFCVPKSAVQLQYVSNYAEEVGVRRSLDGGVSWEWANNGLPAASKKTGSDVVGLKMHPDNSAKLYACIYGSNGGLYVTENNATSWTKHPTFPSNITSVLDLHFSIDGKIYVSCGMPNGDLDDGGVWVSDDNGDTWKQLFRSVWVQTAKTAAYDPNVILLQVNGWKKEPIINPGTYLSKDGGETWSKVNKGNPQSDRINDIAIHQTLPDIYYISTWGCGWHRGTVKSPELTKGYNLVSLPSIPDDPQPETAFSSILQSIDFVTDLTNGSFSYIDDKWENSLGNLQANKGYLIKTNEKVKMPVYNSSKAKPASLDYMKGENLIPVIGRGPVQPLIYLGQIEGDIEFIRDENGKTMRKIDGNWINNIGYLIGGKSYIVQTTRAGTLHIK